MKIAWYRKKMTIYSRKLEKMSPGQRRSWYAQWMKRRLKRMASRIQAIEAAQPFRSTPGGNYKSDFDELRRL